VELSIDTNARAGRPTPAAGGLDEAARRRTAEELLVGRSKAIVEARELLLKVGRSAASTVLLTGESGVGKDVAAHLIHVTSSRAAGPFVNITCSALQDSLLESELFGHERGAFTDAKQRKPGLFEQAHGGTAFLDEVGEMSPPLQAKLLRFLEERAFRRVGGGEDLHADVRVIGATHRDLVHAVDEGRFREDLFYRLAVIQVPLPPLREREGDVELLAEYFAGRFGQQFRSSAVTLSAQACERLRRHAWPGNVRELKNAVERAVLLSEHSELRASDFHLASALPGLNARRWELPPEGVDLEWLERELLRQALERTGGNKTRAATLLGLTRDQVRHRVEKLELEGEQDPAIDG
jgi:transcriptional regulator with PAS, ATPase and Fis domain